MNDAVKVGVVGCNIGKSHVEAYQQLPDLFQVVAVCDIDETPLAERRRSAVHGVEV